jgi:Ala-tRNA(Pro) deacylase
MIMQHEFDELIDLLDMNKVKYKLSEHAPVRTSEEAAAVRGVPLKTGVKALVFKVHRERGTDLILALVRADHKIDSQKLAEAAAAGNAKLASPEEVLSRTGCEIGSVHPFGNLYGLQVYMDRSIMENDEINFNAGLHHKSLNMKSADLVALIQPTVVDIEKT